MKSTTSSSWSCARSICSAVAQPSRRTDALVLPHANPHTYKEFSIVTPFMQAVRPYAIASSPRSRKSSSDWCKQWIPLKLQSDCRLSSHHSTFCRFKLTTMWRVAVRSPSSLAVRSFPRLWSRYASSAAFDRDEYGLFIDGEFVSASGTGEDSRLVVENPATTERLAYVANATAADVDHAVASGQHAFETGSWSRASVADRANVLNDIAKALRKRIPEFAEKESLQTGRPIREMRAQLTRIPGAWRVNEL